MILALGAFAASAMVDLFLSEDLPLYRFGEDGSKLLGIAAWAAFHYRAAWLFLTQRVDR